MSIIRQIKRELLLSTRQPAAILNPLVFFVIVVSLFPLTLGSDPQLLARLAPGIIWVAALLANLLSLNRLFQDDFIDGSLLQQCLLPQPLMVTTLIKIAVYWLTASVPLIIVTPLLALMLNLSYHALAILLLTLLLGTPVLSCLGAVVAALLVSVRHASALLALLLLPLLIPVIVFAANSVALAAGGAGVKGQLALLGAMLLLALVSCPWLAAAALRIGLE